MFTAGRGFYAGPHPGIQPPSRPLNPVAARPRSQSVADVANSQVNQQLAPVLGAQDAANAKQNEAIKQFALALLGKLEPIAGQVGGEYDKAIGQTAALSGATAQALRNANPNQQDQEMLAAINAPQAQRDQIQNQNADTFGGGAAALQFTQGEVPGTQLATNKAAAVSQAAQLPGIAALKGQQDFASALGQQAQTRRETLAERPGMVQAAEDKIHGNIDARNAAAYDRYKFETARADALAATGQKEKATAAYKQAELTYKYASLDSQNTRAANAQAGEDTRNNARIEAANTRARLARTKKKAGGTLTPGEKAQLKKDAGTQADLFYFGVSPVTRADGSVSKPGVPGINYGVAVKRLQSQYSLSAADARTIANDYYAPGERGRPQKPPPKHPKPDTGFRTVKIP